MAVVLAAATVEVVFLVSLKRQSAVEGHIHSKRDMLQLHCCAVVTNGYFQDNLSGDSKLFCREPDGYTKGLDSKEAILSDSLH